jgi:hypothetical protein
MGIEHIEILEKSRHDIRTGYKIYTCNTIPRTPAGIEILNMIHKSLEGCHSVDIWLYDTHGIELDARQAQQYRVKWIEWMIEGWKAKEGMV